MTTMKLIESYNITKRNFFDAILYIFITLFLSIGIYYLFTGLTHGIDDLYGFRQTQTAITAFWLEKEPHLLSYITPALGYPWAMPFEYPIYQWMIVGFMKLGIPLIEAGRVISFLSFVACLLPTKMLFRDFSLSNRTYLIFVCLFLGSPFYIFWSRTLMLELTALLFTLCWLAFVVRYRSTPTLWNWFSILGFGTLAFLTKITTALGILPFVALFSISDLVFFTKNRSASNFRLTLLRGFPTLISILIGGGWVLASDYVRAANPFGYFLSSSALLSWNFGDFYQRLQLSPVIARSLIDTFGYMGVLVPGLIILDALNNKLIRPMTWSVLCYLIPFFVFTNLHTLHNYYQAANAIFICLAAAIAISSLLKNGWLQIGTSALLAISFSQLVYFHNNYRHYIVFDNLTEPVIQAALAAKSATATADSILVVGDDWSSRIPFYSERKSLALPSWAKTSLIQDVLSNPQKFLGESPLGAIVDCLPGNPKAYPEIDPIRSYLDGKAIIFQNASCRVLSPCKGPPNQSVKSVSVPADFDEQAYLRLYLDVAASGMNAAQHFCDFGYSEGRRYK